MGARPLYLFLKNIHNTGGSSMRNQISKIGITIGVLFLLLILFAPMLAAEEKLVGNTVNINTGTAEELAQVPLVTEELADAIVEYREEAGEFQVIEELLQVDGFDRKLLRRIKTFLILEGIGGDECTC
jgi:competence ComEA-like helix-hairpin-helix protein